jgi:hypothetical protein
VATGRLDCIAQGLNSDKEAAKLPIYNKVKDLDVILEEDWKTWKTGR